jgi:hypothetical protein
MHDISCLNTVTIKEIVISDMKSYRLADANVRGKPQPQFSRQKKKTYFKRNIRIIQNAIFLTEPYSKPKRQLML